MENRFSFEQFSLETFLFYNNFQFLFQSLKFKEF